MKKIALLAAPIAILVALFIFQPNDGAVNACAAMPGAPTTHGCACNQNWYWLEGHTPTEDATDPGFWAGYCANVPLSACPMTPAIKKLLSMNGFENGSGIAPACNNICNITQNNVNDRCSCVVNGVMNSNLCERGATCLSTGRCQPGFADPNPTDPTPDSVPDLSTPQIPSTPAEICASIITPDGSIPTAIISRSGAFTCNVCNTVCDKRTCKRVPPPTGGASVALNQIPAPLSTNTANVFQAFWNFITHSR